MVAEARAVGVMAGEGKVAVAKEVEPVAWVEASRAAEATEVEAKALGRPPRRTPSVME